MQFLFTTLAIWSVVTAAMAAPQGYSLRFHGTGAGDEDRVKIPIDTPSRPVDVGGDFTVEFFMKGDGAENTGWVQAANNGDGWITGNVIIDRDVYNSGDYGDWGIAVGNNGRLAFGMDRLGTGRTIAMSSGSVLDGLWHHISVTRISASGQMRIYVDGVQVASGTGPTGDVSYRDGRSTLYPNSDPFLVLGAEKHDAGSEYPSFSGWLDELRISHVVRYSSAFTPTVVPFEPDAQTAGLYHFDEGHGINIYDTADNVGGTSHGTRRVGSSPPGTPWWSNDTPFLQAADHDGDGIWDWYETAWSASSGELLANEDLDGDGANNQQEFAAGTSPVDATSLLVMNQPEYSASGFAFSFPSVEGKIYRVWYSPDLQNPWYTLGEQITGTGAEIPVIDDGVSGETRMFYRISTGP